MSQIWVSSTERGDLRFVPRLVFWYESFPQSACGTCRWRRTCTDLLEDAGAEDFWLVRDRTTASSDGRAFDYCGRTFTDANMPSDIRVLRHTLSAGLKTHVAKPGPPLKRPRERRSPRLVLIPVSS